MKVRKRKYKKFKKEIESINERIVDRINQLLQNGCDYRESGSFANYHRCVEIANTLKLVQKNIDKALEKLK